MKKILFLISLIVFTVASLNLYFVPSKARTLPKETFEKNQNDNEIVRTDKRSESFERLIEKAENEGAVC
jgi:hypothetical protein